MNTNISVNEDNSAKCETTFKEENITTINSSKLNRKDKDKTKDKWSHPLYR